MPYTAYIHRKFSYASQKLINTCEYICKDYEAQGYDLTLRQLYYQLVAKAIIPNKDTEYDRLGSIINDARLAGQIDWNHITDRTRNMKELAHFDDPAHIIKDTSKYHHLDKWADQKNYVEVWVEKEALAGIVGQVAQRYDCPYFSCRGYVSQSEMYAAGRRLAQKMETHDRVVIIHLGDHDPSGIDMTRDIKQRLSLFMTDGFDGCYFDKEDFWEIEDAQRDVLLDQITVDRIALNMDQVRTYNPPPNPAKLTDSRCPDYVAKYGSSSWELDALSPTQMDELISRSIMKYIEADKFNAGIAQQKKEREQLDLLSSRWADVIQFLEEPAA